MTFLHIQVTLLDEDSYDEDHALASAPHEPMYTHVEVDPEPQSDSESSEHNSGQQSNSLH